MGSQIAFRPFTTTIAAAPYVTATTIAADHYVKALSDSSTQIPVQLAPLSFPLVFLWLPWSHGKPQWQVEKLNHHQLRCQFFSIWHIHLYICS